MSDDIAFISEVANMGGDDEFEKQLSLLTKKITSILLESHDVHGIAVMTYDGLIAIVIGKNEMHFNNLKQTGEIVSQLQPRQFFNRLPEEIEYHGIGHMEFPEFEVHFAKINDNLAIVFIATDIHFQVFEHTRKIIKTVKLLIENPEELEEKEELPPPTYAEKKKERQDPRKLLKSINQSEEENELEVDEKKKDENVEIKSRKYEDEYASKSKRVETQSYLRPVKKIRDENSINNDEQDKINIELSEDNKSVGTQEIKKESLSENDETSISKDSISTIGPNIKKEEKPKKKENDLSSLSSKLYRKLNENKED